MAKLAHAMSKTRKRSHIPLNSQLRILDRKPPLKLLDPVELDPPLTPEAIASGRCLDGSDGRIKL
jgi:hypothetical protein